MAQMYIWPRKKAAVQAETDWALLITISAREYQSMLQKYEADFGGNRAYQPKRIHSRITNQSHKRASSEYIKEWHRFGRWGEVAQERWNSAEKE